MSSIEFERITPEEIVAKRHPKGRRANGTYRALIEAAREGSIAIVAGDPIAAKKMENNIRVMASRMGMPVSCYKLTDGRIAITVRQ